MNISDNSQVKACGFNDLIKYRDYWMVTCGEITHIVYMGDGISSEILRYIKADDILDDNANSHFRYYSDMGIWDHPNSSYKNLLNRIFSTEELAERFVYSKEYKAAITKHRQTVGSFKTTTRFNNYRSSIVIST